MKKLRYMAHVALGATLASCSATGSEIYRAKAPTMIYTGAAPSSLAVTSKGGWFAYGTSIDGRSGVGFVQQQRVTAVLTSKQGFQLDDVVTGVGEDVWFSASQDSGRNFPSGTIGKVTLHGFQRIATLPDGAASIVFDHYAKVLMFARAAPNDYGTLKTNGAIAICKLPEASYSLRSGAGPLFIASGGKSTWIFSSVHASLMLLGPGCSRKTVSTLLADDVIAGLAVDTVGRAWLLDQTRSNAVLADSAGNLSSVKPKMTGTLTSVGIVRKTVCFTSNSPTEIACRRPGGWIVKRLPYQGTISAIGYDSTSVWLAYSSLDGHPSAGGIARLPISSILL